MADRLSHTFAALADPTRRAILARLALGETSVGELAQPFDMSLPAVSKHLKVLERAGLISRSREAQWRPCRLEPRALMGVNEWLDHYRALWEARFDRLDDYLKRCKPRRRNVAGNPAESGNRFVIARSFDAPRELVFRAWTESGHLMHWWGPKGFKMLSATLDLRPGGIFHYGMQTPDGKTLWGKWTFHEIVKPERLVVVVIFSDAEGGLTRHPFAPDWPRETLSTMTFTERDGKTTVTVEWSACNATAAEQHVFNTSHASINAGWGGTFDQLETYLAAAQRNS